MAIVRMGFDRIPYLGAFALCTNRVALLPSNLYFREVDAERVLGVPLVRTHVDGSPLIGIMATGNSSCVICSDLFEVGSESRLLELNVGLTHIPGKFTALGNLILANDYGAIANPDTPEETLEIIREKLGVAIECGTIAGIKNVGAAGVATNRGVLLHPDVTSEELKILESTLRVPADVGTACGGFKLVGLCMAANSNGAIVGATTTGPELGRVESALGFL